MADTLARLFRQTISYDKPDAILFKHGGSYRPISSQELYHRAGRVHLDLKKVGIQPGDRCALLSENRWEWAVADFAMMTAGIVSVPLYPTLPADSLHYMIEHSGCRVAMVSTAEQLEKMLEIWPRLPKLEGVVVFDTFESTDPRVISFERLAGSQPLTPEERHDFEAAVNSVGPADMASIIYTSGTTGTPKGVMLTHGNFASNVRDCGIEIRTSDVCLSFLPLCHVAERTADYNYFYNGATVAYAESMEAVAENLREVRPTIAVGVPRFFEKIHSRALAAVASASPARRKLFHWAIEAGRRSVPYRLRHESLPFGLRLQYSLADALVFRKLRARLGGRIRFFVSGSAPLAPHLAEFFYAAGIPVCEAYGLTETAPLVSINQPDDLRFGTVGKVIANVEVKIAPDGEILARGPNVMKGYYRMDELTAETIVDGWLHTGDIGKFEDGYLKITDRKKDLLKTSGGKYIAPQPVENRLKSSPYITNALVIADSRKFPSAVIVPEFDQLRRWAGDNGVEFRNDRELVAKPKVRELLEREVAKACEALPRHEQVKKILVMDREFSLEKGELTPTMKVRRRAVELLHSRAIDQMYEEESNF